MKSFRVFLHGNHLIAILDLVRLARFCSRRKVSITAQNIQGIVRNIGGEYAGPFAGIGTVAYFKVCEICLKMSSPIHLIK